MKRWLYVIRAGLPLVAIGCATARTPLVLDPVGPDGPVPQASPSTGYLQVYSATESYHDGVCYFPHTDYRIYSVDGTQLLRVRNATDMIDEEPALVRLPVGRYIAKVVAESYGMVIVPVVIEDGRTTLVHLERRSSTDGSLPVKDAAHVRLPNGQIVGARAGADDRTTVFEPGLVLDRNHSY